MKSSLRRISVALLGVGVVALSGATAVQVVALCGSGGAACLTAAVSFGVPSYEAAWPSASLTTGISTAAVATTEPTMAEFLLEFFQVTSIYLIFIAVSLLVVLECLELYYIRRLFRRHRPQQVSFTIRS